jgi:hypothetical protein
MVAAAAMIAQQVAGKATRDTLFLSNFNVTQWPIMLVGASIISIAVALLTARTMTLLSPGKFVPAAFGASAALLLGVWFLSTRDAKAAAVALYLHIAVVGPVLISGYWSMFNERFDPRTAKRQMGWIGAVGTLGGLLGGLLAVRVSASAGVSAMISVLAGMHLICAVVMRGLAQPERQGAVSRAGPGDQPASAEMLAGFRYLWGKPYLRNLAMLVLLGTVSAALLDYVFRTYATASFAGDELMHVFSWFYTGVALLAFVVQITMSRLSLNRLRLAEMVATLPITVAGGSLAVLLAPNLLSAGIARGMEMVLRNSLFRSGYELLYTPVAPQEKRATKTIVDVGFERLGDAVGGGAVTAVLVLASQGANTVLLIAALILALGALAVAYRLHHGYVEALESSLVRGAVRLDAGVPLDLSQTIDTSVLSIALGTPQTLGGDPRGSKVAGARSSSSSSGSGPFAPARTVVPAPDPKAAPPPATEIPAEVRQLTERVLELSSGVPERIVRVLSNGLTPELVPHAIPLLARDEVAHDVVRALRKVAPSVTGQLLDVLLDSDRDLAVRRRIPRVLSACGTGRAVEGLFRGLEDQRFEIRLQCGRALARIRENAPDQPIDPEQVVAAVLREVAVERRVWESQRQIDRLEEPGESRFVEDYLRERANASLEHVFTLLSLALTQQPLLRIAFHDLHAEDLKRRGTALEYLECVLPLAVREKLWPFLEDHGARAGPARPREEIIADLLRTNESIRINLAELRKLHQGG